MKFTRIAGVSQTFAPSLRVAAIAALFLTFAGAANAQIVTGPVAAGQNISGNPIPIGGWDGTHVQWLRAGQAAGSDGQANTALWETLTASQQLAFNGTSTDRIYNNVDTGALITAAGATTTQTGADQTNYNGRGVKVVLDMTTVGTGSVTLEIDGKDGASGKYYAILTGAAVITNVTNVYTVYPGVTAASNVSVSDVLPRVWRVKVTANNANAATYTVGANVIN